MALQKTIALSSGLTADNAYIRIDTVSGYKGQITISVNSYVSQAEFTGGQGYLEQKMYLFVPSVADDALNFIKQGYVYLKTLTEFVDAVDC
ncbi:hypothetical protein SPSIL_015230 [Sporomusa silvacetica DSM 10669]|uniref:Uncharacterized protein n=1 Tax=Sporomusa silvacetica DSM 10669 TaxID=1123289 RepID=A0ABZ3IJ81_9FIRM|nr:hypothetical protein [Sporomusa silvacetica]OZC21585.1 hypothetical protein SPSIL_09960 [Sporomusa silvacetica DSM 10669]